MLLNNLHALRVHTQGLFEDMGGEEVRILSQSLPFLLKVGCVSMGLFVAVLLM